jgi:sugar phosphate isomerase/epimerase
MCQKAVLWGYDGIEFRRFRKGVDEIAVDYLDSILSAQRKHGLKYVFFGGPGPDLMTDNVEKRDADLADCERFYRMAADRFPLTVCNIFAGSLRNSDSTIPHSEYHRHGSAVATEQHWQQATVGFQRLGDLAATLNFRFAFETHMVYLHDTPQATRRLVDMIDRTNVGINLDYGNYVYFKGAASISETIKTCGDKLYYIHLKNSVRVPGGSRMATGLSEGDINQREFLKALKLSGYTGPLCLEAPRSGDREWFAQQDLMYLRSVLNDLSW